MADVAFADLLLVQPVSGSGRDPLANRWRIAAQIRPTTHQTLYPDDLVGELVDPAIRPSLADSWSSRQIVEANVLAFGSRQPARCCVIPVCTSPVAAPIAVLLREEPLDTARRRGQLERAYLDVFDQLASMIVIGSFPFQESEETEEPPRVGDGVMLFGNTGRLRYVSPNATSALHRLGIRMNTDAKTLPEIGIGDELVRRSRSSGKPSSGELHLVPIVQPVGLGVRQLVASSAVDIEESSGGHSGGAVIVAHALPLLDDVLLLVRDVTDLRRRDRLLVSKDATIREVHHRVKNNLQTISALLRLQGRRLTSPEAREALEESVRRIRSIALVHETLAQGVTDAVPFGDVLRPLTRIVEEGLQGTEQPVRFTIADTNLLLAPDIATPLAVVLVELLQNAVEHGFPVVSSAGERLSGRTVTVSFEELTAERLVKVRVADDGVGFPPGFSLSTTRSLGLTIVRTLVVSELGGVISTWNDSGAVVEIRLPLDKLMV
jgi:two-component system, sensor histidine kinase PdtaS